MAFSTNYEDTKFSLKPEGEYECVIKSACQTTTKFGTPYIAVNLSIRTDVKNPCKGMIFHELWMRKPENMTAADKACDGYSSKQINALSQAAGLPDGKLYEDLNAWCGDLKKRCVRVVLEHDTYNGDAREKVKWFNASKVPAPALEEEDFIDLEDDDDLPF